MSMTGELLPNANITKNDDSTKRNYQEDTPVAEFYNLNRTNQSFEFVQKTKQEMLPIGKFGEHDIFDIISLMDEIVDDSDPDTRNPQIFHAIQTGEACRKMYPDLDWFHLLGFMHDMGKVIAHKKMGSIPQWAVVGDTFPTGCQYSEECVYHHYFKNNPDSQNEKFNTKYGIYEANIGFDNIQMSWGHDEYMYQVLKANENRLPDSALYVVRYHSFYPWHNKGAYEHLASKKDHEYLQYLKAFQKCDLYSKVEEEINVEKMLPYYKGLIVKYFPSTILKW